MVASAYSDGKLGPAQGTDALSVIRLGRPPAELRAVATDVSNSVTAPPASVAVTPDDCYAIVAELRGARPAGKTHPTMSDLPDGRGLFVIDLADPDHPKVVQRLAGGERANSVSINAAGSLVAVAFRPRAASQSPLTVYEFSEGRLSAPATPAIPDWTIGDDLLGAEFHPKENSLALLNGTQPALSFVRVATAGGLSLVGLGNAVGIGKGPYLAKFTPDGRHVVVNATFTGPDALLGGFGSPRGATPAGALLPAQSYFGFTRHPAAPAFNADHFRAGAVPAAAG